jgi:hypothetical protein
MGIKTLLVQGTPKNFHVQVKHAEDAIAAGAMFCNDVHDALIIMSRPLIVCTLEQHRPHYHMQVKHAEDAGASGAIVYDDVYEALIIMSKPRDHAEPGIPSVFVAQKTGIVMKKLMTPGATMVRITPVSVTPLSHTWLVNSTTRQWIDIITS